MCLVSLSVLTSGCVHVQGFLGNNTDSLCHETDLLSRLAKCDH
jgi:hypothetical protein